MPETKIEWLCFLLGLVVIVVLVYAIVESRTSESRHAEATAPQPAVRL
jgi:hypothetical protein